MFLILDALFDIKKNMNIIGILKKNHFISWLSEAYGLDSHTTVGVQNNNQFEKRNQKTNYFYICSYKL